MRSLSDPRRKIQLLHITQRIKTAEKLATTYNTATITAGTGKYAGISGGWSFIAHGSEFKAPEGRYAQYGSVKGSYKLP